MEQGFFLLVNIGISALVALLGSNRNIGYGWSFLLCLVLSPIIGVFIILMSKKKKDVEFIDIPKETKKD